MKTMSQKKKVFQTAIWKFYNKNKRDSLPWRKKITPYRIWVSEIMLQQTQVDRVIPFFNHWMKLFPTIQKLAGAPQAEVLRAWKGLGYNSRALRMKKTAQIICEKHHGKFPKTYDEVLKLPGIGPYTAGALMAFAYDESVVMIETNIRRVYLHHFFTPPAFGHLPLAGEDSRTVHDRDILELIKKTLPKENFREWYWALMDYGAYLGKTIPNPNKKSRHYTVQKKFQGSDREIRGKVLEILLEQKKVSKKKLFAILRKQIKSLPENSERLEGVLAGLEQEGFLAASSSRTSVQLR
jgi:A/G-specific adenine glycosylase